MDDENSNGCSYTEELSYLVSLITALEYIVNLLEDRPVLYPMFMADVVCLVHGRKAKIGNREVFVNGLEQQIEELYDTMEALELEVQFELSPPELEEGEKDEDTQGEDDLPDEE